MYLYVLGLISLPLLFLFVNGSATECEKSAPLQALEPGRVYLSERSVAGQVLLLRYFLRKEDDERPCALGFGDTMLELDLKSEAGALSDTDKKRMCVPQRVAQELAAEFGKLPFFSNSGSLEEPGKLLYIPSSATAKSSKAGRKPHVSWSAILLNHQGFNLVPKLRLTMSQGDSLVQLADGKDILQNHEIGSSLFPSVLANQHVMLRLRMMLDDSQYLSFERPLAGLPVSVFHKKAQGGNTSPLAMLCIQRTSVGSFEGATLTTYTPLDDFSGILEKQRIQSTKKWHVKFLNKLVTLGIMSSNFIVVMDPMPFTVKNPDDYLNSRESDNQPSTKGGSKPGMHQQHYGRNRLAKAAGHHWQHLTRDNLPGNRAWKVSFRQLQLDEVTYGRDYQERLLTGVEDDKGRVEPELPGANPPSTSSASGGDCNQVFEIVMSDNPLTATRVNGKQALDAFLDMILKAPVMSPLIKSSKKALGIKEGTASKYANSVALIHLPSRRVITQYWMSNPLAWFSVKYTSPTALTLKFPQLANSCYFMYRSRNDYGKFVGSPIDIIFRQGLFKLLIELTSVGSNEDVMMELRKFGPQDVPTVKVNDQPIQEIQCTSPTSLTVSFFNPSATNSGSGSEAAADIREFRIKKEGVFSMLQFLASKYKLDQKIKFTNY